ncbi:MAG: GTP pyrophosphokinase [Magnetococcus sp. DMHC-6]
MSTLEQAIQTATLGHAGQMDKAGQPYILHPLRLMLQATTREEQIVAVLHDVVEDTNITLEDLQQAGFSPTILTAVACLTRHPNDSYDLYLERIKSNSLACKVKINDLEDNMNLRRLPATLTERDCLRLQKYQKAWHNLKALESLHEP